VPELFRSGNQLRFRERRRHIRAPVVYGAIAGRNVGQRGQHFLPGYVVRPELRAGGMGTAFAENHPGADDVSRDDF